MARTLEALELDTSAQAAQAYGALTHDFNPIHLDADFAARTPFGRPIAHGTMALNLALEALGRIAPVAEIEIRFTAPTYVGERLVTGGLADEAGAWEIWVEARDMSQGTGRRVLEGRARLAS